MRTVKGRAAALKRENERSMDECPTLVKCLTERKRDGQSVLPKKMTNSRTGVHIAIN